MLLENPATMGVLLPPLVLPHLHVDLHELSISARIAEVTEGHPASTALAKADDLVATQEHCSAVHQGLDVLLAGHRISHIRPAGVKVPHRATYREGCSPSISRAESGVRFHKVASSTSCHPLTSRAWLPVPGGTRFWLATGSSALCPSAGPAEKATGCIFASRAAISQSVCRKVPGTPSEQSYVCRAKSFTGQRLQRCIVPGE